MIPEDFVTDFGWKNMTVISDPNWNNLFDYYWRGGKYCLTPEICKDFGIVLLEPKMNLEGCRANNIFACGNTLKRLHATQKAMFSVRTPEPTEQECEEWSEMDEKIGQIDFDKVVGITLNDEWEDWPSWQEVLEKFEAVDLRKVTIHETKI